MTALAPHMSSFLREHSPKERRASQHTCEAYAYSFQLLPSFAADQFKINALKFERAIKQGFEGGRPVKVFFHSHLDCGAYFSAEDAASMTMGGTGDPSFQLSYLVTAVDQGQVTAHKLFIWSPASKSFVEAPFRRVAG